MPRRRKKDPIAVATGECYLIRRPGKRGVRIKITRVVRRPTKYGEQPVATYRRITPAGKPARRGATWEPGPRRGKKKKTHYQSYRTVLTWRGGAWRLPHDAEPVSCKRERGGR
jgi:hypothetical protein